MNFPEEFLILVTNYLDTKLLINCQEVCKKWLKIFRPNKIFVYYESWNTLNPKYKIQIYFGTPKNIKVSNDIVNDYNDWNYCYFNALIETNYDSIKPFFLTIMVIKG